VKYCTEPKVLPGSEYTTAVMSWQFKDMQVNLAVSLITSSGGSLSPPALCRGSSVRCCCIPAYQVENNVFNPLL